jgi:hypothetical protein
MPRNTFKPVHGHAIRAGRSATYRAWESMLGRCQRPTAGGYEFYGGRGITVCERWQSFDAFLSDMGERPDGMTLDRIDPNGHYEHGNCRWASRATQDVNKRSTRRITRQGRTQSLMEWSVELGLRYATVLDRLNSGWPVEMAFAEPSRSNPWQPQEDALIRAFYPEEGPDVASRLPDRTRVAVEKRAQILRVRALHRRRA